MTPTVSALLAEAATETELAIDGLADVLVTAHDLGCHDAVASLKAAVATCLDLRRALAGVRR